jgi:hypothetical protein
MGKDKKDKKEKKVAAWTEAEAAAINGLRILSAEMVQNANSGHPGAPMGMAPCAYALFKVRRVVEGTGQWRRGVFFSKKDFFFLFLLFFAFQELYEP